LCGFQMFSQLMGGWLLWVDWERIAVHDIMDDVFLLLVVFFM